MEEMGLYFWFVRTAVLVLLGMDGAAMGHFCVELPLYFCLDARHSLSLAEKEIRLRQEITSQALRSVDGHSLPAYAHQLQFTSTHRLRMMEKAQRAHHVVMAWVYPDELWSSLVFERIMLKRQLC